MTIQDITRLIVLLARQPWQRILMGRGCYGCFMIDVDSFYAMGGRMKKYKMRNSRFILIASGGLVACMAVFYIAVLAPNSHSEKEVGIAWLAPQPVADIEQPGKLYEETKYCTLLLYAPGESEDWYGSGVIWDQDEESVIVVTAAHVLRAVGEELWIGLPVGKKDGTFLPGKILGLSKERDIGFAAFEKQALADLGLLDALYYVSLHRRTFDTLTVGDSCFATGSGKDAIGSLFYPLIVLERGYPAEEIGENLLLFEGACVQGMSGSGVYDGYGHLIGIVVATSDERCVAVPATDVNEAYGEILHKKRNMEDY